MDKTACPNCAASLDALRSLVALARDTMSGWDADRFTPEGKLLSALAGQEAGYSPQVDAIHALLSRTGP